MWPFKKKLRKFKLEAVQEKIELNAVDIKYHMVDGTILTRKIKESVEPNIRKVDLRTGQYYHGYQESSNDIVLMNTSNFKKTITYVKNNYGFGSQFKDKITNSDVVLNFKQVVYEEYGIPYVDEVVETYYEILVPIEEK
jgi:hypothetical protein